MLASSNTNDNNSLDDDNVVNLENNFSEEEYINNAVGCSFVWGLVQTASTEAVDHEACKPQWRLFQKKNKEEVLLVLHINHNNTNLELVVSHPGKEIDKWVTRRVKTSSC